MYSHMDLIVPAEDVPVAQDAMRLWLWEQPEAARARAGELRADSRARQLCPELAQVAYWLEQRSDVGEENQQIAGRQAAAQ